MEYELMRLCELPAHAAGVVEAVDECDMRERLEGLGLTPGAEVVRLFSAPCGEPTAYSVRGSVAALRRRDAAAVTVRVRIWD
ncbi:MAG: ferrous iron transport protein A [Clostridia bacterium]|nr:ferrous iron transport protein A [Clostridia bacterium]